MFDWWEHVGKVFQTTPPEEVITPVTADWPECDHVDVHWGYSGTKDFDFYRVCYRKVWHSFSLTSCSLSSTSCNWTDGLKAGCKKVYATQATIPVDECSDYEIAVYGFESPTSAATPFGLIGVSTPACGLPCYYPDPIYIAFGCTTVFSTIFNGWVDHVNEVIGRDELYRLIGTAYEQSAREEFGEYAYPWPELVETLAREDGLDVTRDNSAAIQALLENMPAAYMRLDEMLPPATRLEDWLEAEYADEYGLLKELAEER